MRTRQRDWFRFTVVASRVLIVSVLLGPAPRAAQRPTLIRNAALILTMDATVGQGELGIIADADVLIDGDTIAAVGKQLPPHGADVVDAAGKIVMPGFVDTHNHLWQSLIRGCGASADLTGWLAACVLPLFGFNFSQADVYAGVRLSTLDLITTGVTTTVDFSHAFTPEFVRANIQALNDSGLRFAFAYRGSPDPAVIADMRLVKRTLIDPNPRAVFQVGSHPGTQPLFFPGLVAMTNLAQELNVQLHVHLLEHISQRADMPFEALAQANALGPNLLGAHGIHLLDSEIQILADHDARIMHNPLSNMRLASGVIRLPSLKQAGVQVGLGLDGGTNDTSDMFNNMRAASGLQRAASLRADVTPTMTQVLRMATVDGAALLNMSDRIGSLTVGKKADMIILDPGAVNFAPTFDTVSQIVLNAQPQNVKWVFVDGRAVKRKGKLVGVNQDAIARNAQAAANRVRQFLFPRISASPSAAPMVEALLRN
jgi:5-methylthioadenosine/S-adenosylhomocysteine deaminase